MKIGVVFISFFTISFPLFAQGTTSESKVVLKELSLEDSYRNLSQEYEALRKEKTRLEKKVKREESRTALFIERIRVLNEEVRSLNRKLKSQEQGEGVASKPMEEKLQRLEQEMTALVKDIDEVRALAVLSKAHGNDSLQKVNSQLHETSVSLELYENEIKTLKRSMVGLLSENERLKEENGHVHYNLGNIFFKEGAYERAASEYEYALWYIPNDPDIYYNLAVIYDYYLKNNEKAVTYYSAYLEKMPKAQDSVLVKERILENTLKSKVTD